MQGQNKRPGLRAGGSSGGDALTTNINANPIWEFIGKIGAFLIIVGALYYAVHIFPPGNALPLQPSSYAVVRGMGHFPSDHIIIPIEWRNSGGQPTLVRNLKLFLINITDPSMNLSDKPELTYELAGEFAKDYSENIGYVGTSYTLKQAYVIDPNAITPTSMVFHIQGWWDPNQKFQFKKSKIIYGVLLNYSYTSFGDLFGREESGSCNIFLFNMTIRNATVDLSKNNNWDSYSTYVSTSVKHWLPFWW